MRANFFVSETGWACLFAYAVRVDSRNNESTPLSTVISYLLRLLYQSTTNRMPESIVWIMIFTAFIAVCRHLGFRIQSLDRRRFCQIIQEWLQGEFTSTMHPTSAHIQPKDDLANVLPPSRRFALPENIKSPSLHDGEASILESQIDINTDCTSCEPTQYTPTDITIDEVKQLGSFPDYASLSGVPLPSPYPGFDIDRALPRPYRPFRWNYHQTMGMSMPFLFITTARLRQSLTTTSTLKDGHRLVDRTGKHIS